MGIEDAGNRVPFTTLLATLRGGNDAAVSQFLRDVAPTIWTACSLLTAEEAEARQAFLDIAGKLRADNFALLTQYAGHGTLETSVALLSRDLLADRVLRLLRSDPKRGWRAFESFFEADLQRLIRRRLPGVSREDVRRDAYQFICLAMVESDYRRLGAYSGNGSFAGFVVRTADRLLIDFVRRSFGRRRGAGLRLMAGSLDRHDIAEDAGASPEEGLIQFEEDRQLTAALDVLTRAVEMLHEDERLYLAIALGAAQTPPSREIARLMQCRVEDIYKLKQRVLKRLRDVIADDSAVKNWRASV